MNISKTQILIFLLVLVNIVVAMGLSVFSSEIVAVALALLVIAASVGGFLWKHRRR